MAVELAVPIAVAAYLILSGQEPECPEIQWTDEAGIEWTEEVCLTSGSSVGTWEVEQGLGGSGAVPEPSVWGLLILGFGFAGGALRRSRAALKLAVDGLADHV